jgi:hypothetical protein
MKPAGGWPRRSSAWPQPIRHLAIGIRCSCLPEAARPSGVFRGAQPLPLLPVPQCIQARCRCLPLEWAPRSLCTARRRCDRLQPIRKRAAIPSLLLAPPTSHARNANRGLCRRGGPPLQDFLWPQLTRGLSQGRRRGAVDQTAAEDGGARSQATTWMLWLQLWLPGAIPVPPTAIVGLLAASRPGARRTLRRPAGVDALAPGAMWVRAGNGPWTCRLLSLLCFISVPLPRVWRAQVIAATGWQSRAAAGRVWVGKRLPLPGQHLDLLVFGLRHCPPLLFQSFELRCTGFHREPGAQRIERSLSRELRLCVKIRVSDAQTLNHLVSSRLQECHAFIQKRGALFHHCANSPQVNTSRQRKIHDIFLLALLPAFNRPVWCIVSCSSPSFDNSSAHRTQLQSRVDYEFNPAVPGFVSKLSHPPPFSFLPPFVLLSWKLLQVPIAMAFPSSQTVGTKTPSPASFVPFLLKWHTQVCLLTLDLIFL